MNSGQQSTPLIKFQLFGIYNHATQCLPLPSATIIIIKSTMLNTAIHHPLRPFQWMSRRCFSGLQYAVQEFRDLQSWPNEVIGLQIQPNSSRTTKIFGAIA
jgi:hypothetical protein